MTAELVLRDDARSIAERNEEINARRLRRAPSGGPLKVTNPEAFKRFVAEAAEAAERERALEAADEAERARREGSAYVPRAQREAEARRREQQSGGEQHDEARGVRDVFDCTKDYYGALGVDRLASAAQLKRAFKRLALQLHPDKQRGASEAQRAALALQFNEAREAFDVLSDEGRRAGYDRARQALLRGGARAGGPPMTAEEAASRLRGLRELARMRREGMRRCATHPPLRADFWASLGQLARGCVKTVLLARSSVDERGCEYEERKALHVSVRRGTPPGTQFTFRGAGSETTELLPGDVVLTLRERPCRAGYRREGAKGLAMWQPPPAPGDAYYCLRIAPLTDDGDGSDEEEEAGGGAAGGPPAPPPPPPPRLQLSGSLLPHWLASGGRGCTVEHRLSGAGLPDPVDPVEQPPGDLCVRMHLPPRPLALLRPAFRARPLLLLPSSADALAGAAAGGALALALREAAAAADVDAGDAPAPRASPPVCLSIAPAGAAAAAGRCAPSAAAAGLMAGCRARWRLACGRLEAAPEGGQTLYGLLDDEWAALHAAPAIVLDFPDEDGDCDEAALRAAREALRAAGLREALWARCAAGAHLAAVGCAMAVIGPHPGDAHALLPLAVRAGGGAAAWRRLHACLAADGGEEVGVGVHAGSALWVGPAVWWAAPDCVDLLVSPPREQLAACAGSLSFRDESCAFYDCGFPEVATREHVLASLPAAL